MSTLALVGIFVFLLLAFCWLATVALAKQNDVERRHNNDFVNNEPLVTNHSLRGLQSGRVTVTLRNGHHIVERTNYVPYE